MENEKAIEIFNKWMDCKDAYQADPSCDGNCFSCEYYASAEEEKEAMLLAISALEKQEKKPAKAKFNKRYNKFVYFCPVCGEVTGNYDFCSECGQAIDYDNPEPYGAEEEA